MQVTTSCRDCIFAEYNGRKQEGCHLGLLSLLGKSGGRIELSTDAAGEGQTPGENGTAKPGEERAFFVIHGRACPGCRHPESPWAKHFPQEEWDSQIRKDMELRVHVLAVFPSDFEDGDVRTTAIGLQSQTHTPTMCHFVVPGGKVRDMARIRDLLRGILDHIPWKAHVSVENDIGVAIDQALAAVDNKDCQCYVLVQGGELIPQPLLAELNRANLRAEKFVLLTPEGGYFGPMVVNFAVHRAVGGFAKAEDDDGNDCSHVALKLARIANQEGQQHLIKSVTSVCPCTDGDEDPNGMYHGVHWSQR